MTPAQLIPWLLSAWTLAALYYAGGKPRLGWALALAGQPLWFAYSWVADAWGFAPLNIGLTVVYARNLALTHWRSLPNSRGHHEPTSGT